MTKTGPQKRKGLEEKVFSRKKERRRVKDGKMAEIGLNDVSSSSESSPRHFRRHRHPPKSERDSIEKERPKTQEREEEETVIHFNFFEGLENCQGFTVDNVTP